MMQCYFGDIYIYASSPFKGELTHSQANAKRRERNKDLTQLLLTTRMHQTVRLGLVLGHIEEETKKTLLRRLAQVRWLWEEKRN